MIKKGTIRAVLGSFASGIGYLVVEVDGEIDEIPCDNAPTVRALEMMYGGVIGQGHVINNINGGHIGREIYFSMVGPMLDGFTPVESAPPELVEAHQYCGLLH